MSWNQIREKAIQFSFAWKDASKERAEAQTFWNEFFDIFNVKRRRIAVYEKQVEKLNGNKGSIDLFWPGTLLIEHKSKGKNLNEARIQAEEYCLGLPQEEFPRYILICDFEKFHLLDLEENTEIKFQLHELEQNIHNFSFIIGQSKYNFEDIEEVNIQAIKLISKIREKLSEAIYEDDDLETFMAQLIFCFFSDDTGIFQTKDHFTYYIQEKTKKDGSDLSMHLEKIFRVLDTPENERNANLDEDLAIFPYVNGKLFKKHVTVPDFNSSLRNDFIQCCLFNWGKISSDIFGALYQAMLKEERRDSSGIHYTSELNILKAIEPLFLDNLSDRFNEARGNVDKLHRVLRDIRETTILDPACGCGNFLIVSYRHLRLLEIEIHKELQNLLRSNHKVLLDDGTYQGIDVDNLYGIEIEECAVAITQVAIWITDHQMNIRLSKEFGTQLKRIPLRKAPNIIIENALRMDWNKIIPVNKLKYIVGNPPFIGKQQRHQPQTEDMKMVFGTTKHILNLDYVTCWYKKSIDYIQNTKIEVAFVSTNSIVQGEQVGILFEELYKNGLKINFAHRTFKWSNDDQKHAQVFVVIIGFAIFHRLKKFIYSYEKLDSKFSKKEVNNINSYLVNSSEHIVKSRKTPASNKIPEMKFGSMPRDGGHFLFDKDEYIYFIKKYPSSKKFFKRFYSAREYLHGQERYCLWLENYSPGEVKSCHGVYEQIKKVKQCRLKSTNPSTKKMSYTPTKFGEIRQPKNSYILIPRHTSELRRYIPLSYYKPTEIVGDSCIFLDNSDKYYFGILSSLMHMIWIKNICGRLKGDYRYSIKLVYNNFPFPINVDEIQKNLVREKANTLIETRKKYENKDTLANLYDDNIMPPDLRKAHKALDKVVDLCYRKKPFENEMERMEYLFGIEYEIFKKAKMGIAIIKKKQEKTNVEESQIES